MKSSSFLMMLLENGYQIKENHAIGGPSNGIGYGIDGIE